MFCGETIVPQGLTGLQLSFYFTVRHRIPGGNPDGSAKYESGYNEVSTYTTGTGAAKEYEEIAGGAGSTNCYGAAIGSSIAQNPGNRAGIDIDKDINKRDVGDMANAVIADMHASGRTGRIINSPKAQIHEYEYRIAIRVKEAPENWYETSTYDYHFMYQTKSGQWAEKHGQAGNSILWDNGQTPDDIPWTLGGSEFYDSRIIYLAISY